ncbi:MAG TPA: hypothetical protein VFK15_03095 [Burkholderiales bacterium]|jgi:hypothetical protein|nr:hypothetical protein [Burkholderiales bacterium]
MEDSAFSQEFFEFIHSAVPSVSVAELLLLVFKEPERWWTVADIRSELPPDVNLTEGAIASGLDDLRTKGIVEYDAEKRARYRPSEPLARHVQTLAQAYNERPVTLIRMIYALRDSRIQSFADAFKFWKK